MHSTTFSVEAVLFDMDGTLTDSVAAVEAAWGKVASDLGMDQTEVIAATHGRRAIDNLKLLRPNMKENEMNDAVAQFERSILDFADHTESEASKDTLSPAQMLFTPANSPTPLSSNHSGNSTPSIVTDNGSSGTSSQGGSPEETKQNDVQTSPSAAQRTSRLCISELQKLGGSDCGKTIDKSALAVLKDLDTSAAKRIAKDLVNAYKAEAVMIDRSIKILPGVKRILEKLPESRYAVATSGAKAYAYGAMGRVGITPPPVTITADDERLKAGKPAPDPFLLAASCLGYPANKCVVFEDSPSGIKSGVASGATVIAVCTSHSRDKIDNCGAHYVVKDMNSVKVEVVQTKEDGSESLEITVESESF